MTDSGSPECTRASHCCDDNQHTLPTLIPSKENLADVLSRVPDYMRKIEPPLHHEEDIALIADVTNQRRDHTGRVIVESEEEIQLIMKAVHEHEGYQTMYDRIRSIVFYPGLSALCRKFTEDCDSCQMTRPNTPMTQAADALRDETERAARQFQYIHMDIAGPYKKIDFLQSFYVVSLVDRYTGYVMTSTKAKCPTARDCLAVIRRVVDLFNTLPEVVHTDNGSQFTCSEFVGGIEEMRCRHVTTPVNASWCNGRVERIHRILNERLRAQTDDNLTYERFQI